MSRELGKVNQQLIQVQHIIVLLSYMFCQVWRSSAKASRGGHNKRLCLKLVDILMVRIVFPRFTCIYFFC